VQKKLPGIKTTLQGKTIFSASGKYNCEAVKKKPEVCHADPNINEVGNIVNGSKSPVNKMVI
jgi:hypothetical protein